MQARSSWRLFLFAIHRLEAGALVVIVALIASAAVSARAQDDAPPTLGSIDPASSDFDDAARPALEAAHGRCPDLAAPTCFDAPAATRGEVHGDRVQVVASCGGEGNGGDFDYDATFDYDLAHCRGTASIAARDQGDGPFQAVFQVFALSSEPATPLPQPPGRLFVPNDPAFAGTQLALTTSCRASRSIDALGVTISAPLVPPHDPIAGRPAAEPAAHLTTAELHAIGAPPHARPVGPGRFLRGYRVTPGIAEGRVVVQQPGYEVIDAACVSVVDRTAGTYRRAFCSTCDGESLAWVEGDGPIAVAIVVDDYSEITPLASFVAIDLERATAHAITLPDDAAINAYALEGRITGDRLRLTDEDGGHLSFSIPELLEAMRRTSEGGPIVGVPPESGGAEGATDDDDDDDSAAEPDPSPAQPAPSVEPSGEAAYEEGPPVEANQAPPPTAAAPSAAPPPPPSGACGCRVARGPVAWPSFIALALALALVRRRRLGSIRARTSAD
jgi:hypothetical protein